jgi:hypothetical protein
MLPSSNSSKFSNTSDLVPHFRVRGITTVPAFISPTLALTPMPSEWLGRSLNLEISASNLTHYALSAGPAFRQYEQKVIGYGNGLGLTWGFTGT